ncbi:nucleotide pyrophosphohydrolase [Candidatus Bathyarchaeota archaeon]|nr:nucleotide pyrophosphohydrolase [Candidatus Bathyarchaeota archaeon]
MKETIKDFVIERDWIKYHTPRNLAESICIESAELLEIFQWSLKNNYKKNESKSFQNSNIKDELADIFIYCISLSNTLEIDIAQTILKKIKKNKSRYPIKKFKVRLRKK